MNTYFIERRRMSERHIAKETKTLEPQTHADEHGIFFLRDFVPWWLDNPVSEHEHHSRFRTGELSLEMHTSFAEFIFQRESSKSKKRYNRRARRDNYSKMDSYWEKVLAKKEKR